MKTIITALALTVAAGTAQSEIKNYDCELHSMQAQGWIPPRVLLSVDADNKRARAYDGAVRSSNELAGLDEETPAKAKFKVTRKNEYKLSWTVTLRASSSYRYRAAYTAVLDPQTNVFKVAVSFPQANLANRPSGVGTCKPVSSPNLF